MLNFSPFFLTVIYLSQQISLFTNYSHLDLDEECFILFIETVGVGVRLPLWGMNYFHIPTKQTRAISIIDIIQGYRYQ